MSARDDSHGGRHEYETRTVGGQGLTVAGRCDECSKDSTASRRRAKVMRGPLRGLFAMVCGDCIALRAKVAA